MDTQFDITLLQSCTDNGGNAPYTEAAGHSSQAANAVDQKKVPLTGKYSEDSEQTNVETIETALEKVSLPNFEIKRCKFNVFFSCLCFVALCESCIVRGYSGAVLTTLQKQFRLSTRQIGLVCTSYEFGHIPFVILASLASQRYNRSKLIGIGGVLMSFGCIMYLVPMLITFYNPNMLLNVISDAIKDDSMFSQSSQNKGPAMCGSVRDSVSKMCATSSGDNAWMVAILSIAQFILGVGASPLYTLGLTYLYENIPERSRYPIYSSLVYALAGLGPAFGFGMASYFLTLYVLPWNLPAEIDGPSHPQFIGAWWIGLIVCSCITFCASIPLFFFPDRFDTPWRDTEQQSISTMTTNSSVNKTRKDAKVKHCEREETQPPDASGSLVSRNSHIFVIRQLKTIFQARIWWGMTVILIAENSVAVWFSTYFPKYLETTFQVQRSNASILTGLILIPAACSGVFAGGMITKKLERTFAILKFLFIITAVNFVLQTASMFIRCEPLPFAGVTFTSEPARVRQLTEHSWPTAANQTSHNDCSAQCDCSLNDYFPVCSRVQGQSESLTFFNPCFAGCTRRSLISGTGNIGYEYFDCSCAAAALENNSAADFARTNASFAEFIVVTSGICDSNCDKLIPFIAVIFIIVFVFTSGHNSTLILTIQSVGETHRSFALACQTFFIRTLAFLPSPIYFGQLFDSHCILTQPDNCNVSAEDDASIDHNNGYCILYDTFMLPFTMLGCTLVFKLVVTLSLTFCLWFVKREQTKRTALMQQVVNENYVKRSPLCVDG